MPDRSKAPKIKTIDYITIPAVETHYLDNGIPLYEIPMGTQEVLKLEVVFNAGRPYETKPMVAKATCSLLKDGTHQLSGADIADTLDYYGSSLEFPFHMDTSNVILYTISKHFEHLLPIVYKLIRAPLFSAKELEAYKTRSFNKLKIDLAKNEIIAYRKVTELIFGANHPYGYNSSEELIKSINRDDLYAHHAKLYTAANCKIFLSGKTKPELIQKINALFGRLPAGEVQKPLWGASPAGQPGLVKMVGKNTQQTSIRIGRKMFNRQHPKFSEVFMLNTILGGYFGSRLMSNIREEKGYTYNIFSALDHFVFDGYFYISAEIGNDFVQPTLKEISYEIDKLKEERISSEELDMVKNYLWGYFLTILDGPFNASEVVRNLTVEGMPHNFLNQMIRSIKEITPDDLQQLAQEYLDIEQMWQVIVGN